MQNETRQPRRWAEVAASEQFLALAPERQERARQLYFQEVVLPRVPAGMELRARKLFDQDTQGTLGRSTLGADAESPESGNLLTDTGNLLASGVNRAAQNVRELVGRIPVVGEGLLAAGDAADRFLSGKDSETLLRENEQKYQQNLTPEMRGAQQKLWWDEETGSLGSAWTDPRAYASGIIQSLPEMAITMGAAGRLAKGAYARALAKTGDKAVAAKAAARMATVAGGVSEGLLGGADTARQVRDQIAAMPLEQLQQSEAFQTLLEEGLQPEEARAQLAEDSATQGLLIAGAATGVFGGMGDRALANLLTGRVTAGIGGRIAKGAIGEGLLEELPQSMGQQLAENYVMQDADPSRELGAGVLNAGLGGLATGAVMGGGLGAVATSRTGPSDAGPAAAQDLATPEATFENTPEPAALPAPGLQGLPPPEPVYYADSQGNVQETGPVRNVDGEQRPEPQARQWINPQNDPARMPGGPGMDQPTPRGEPAPLAGEFQHGSRPAAPGRAAAEPATVDAAPERQALPAPDGIVVDSQGNAQRGPTGPFVAPNPERPLPGGRGMDQQAPTADSSGAPDLEIRLRKNGKPFQGRGDARASILYREAVKAGEQPQIVRHGDGWAVAVPKQQEPQPLRPARPIDQQADQAATSPNNDLPAPTPAQIEAGNYRKGHVRVAGLDIAIENPRGSERSGKRPDGAEWRHTMSDHYGYIKRTVGADQEQVDVYLGPQEDSDQVFIVDQLHQQDGSFDEHKVMLGYPNQAAAVEAYRSNFDPDWKVGEVTAMPVEQFKRWLKEGDLAKPAQAHAGPAAGAVAEQGAAASFTPYADSYRQAVIDEYIAEGVPSDVAERLAGRPRSSAPIDATTGLFEGRREAEDGSTDTERAIGRAIEYVAATDGEAYWVSADIANLGGLNAHFNNVARDANKHYRALVDIVRKELGAVGQVEGFRTGGDEFGALVIGGERAAVEAALDRARQAAAAYTRSEGLDKIIHPKHPDDESKRGVGLHLGYVQMSNSDAPDRVMADADRAMDQSKRGESHVSGSQVAAADSVPRDQRSGGAEKAPGREHGPAREGAAGDGRTPSGEADPAATDRVSDTSSSFSADKELASGAERNAPAKRDQAEEALPAKQVAAEKPAATPKPTKKIEDFGERIEGARKFASYTQQLDVAMQADLKAVPLSKSWPEPDYQALLDQGGDPWAVAFAHAARDEVPTKPSNPYKLSRWADQVDFLRNATRRVLDQGELTEEVRSSLYKNHPALRGLAGRVELYQRFGHAHSLKGITFAERYFSMYRGEKNVNKWIASKDAKATALSNWPQELASGNTKQEALDAFAEVHAKLASVKKKADNAIRFDVFSQRGERGYFIGKKNGKRVARLRSFDSLAEARKYLGENQSSLERQYDALKEVPAHRGEGNAPRVGVDYRNGQDVTPELFSETFGFRGVQFGNYVENNRRQQELNEAFDALSDLAGILNIPAKALSLNGELALAFGARGRGGPDPAKAHYESGETVINLTKGNGAGSLAHEWWHAFDNYLSRARSQPDAYITEQPYNRGEGVRPELIEAFSSLMSALKATGLQKRSEQWDATRSKDYWSTALEMSARAFESYVVAKLQDAGISSDYLANIVSETAYSDSDRYPYLKAAELPSVRAAFDELFGIIETRETDRGVQMYRFGGRGQVSAVEIQTAIDKHPELASIQVVQAFGDLPLSVRIRAERDGVQPYEVRGVFRPDAQYLVADNQQDLEEAIRTAVHEMVGHQGIRGLLGDQLNGTLERIYSSEMARTTGRQRVAQIREHYASVLEGKSAAEQRLLIAEEIIAHLAESGDRPTVLQRVASKIRELLRKLFPQVNWTYTDVLALIEQSRDWLRAQRANLSGSDQRYSRRGWSADFPDTVLAHPLSFLNNHPDYAAAKAGDDAAALRVARDAVTPEFIERVRELIPEGSSPRIVPVLAREGAGDNRIPLMAAEVLAQRLGLETDTNVMQAQKVGRTQSNALERIANQPTFDGGVVAAEYLLLDDTLTQGGTLAQLKTHIEDNGGRVLAALALTGKNYSRKLAIDPDTLAQVRGKYSDIEPWWRETFGYGFEGLTQSEARTLLTFDKGQLSPDEIRDRISAARDEGLFRVGQAATGDRSGTETPVDPSEDTRYSLRSTRPHVSEAFADLSQAERDALGKIAPPTARQRATLWFRERADRAMTKIRQGLVDRYAALKELDEKAHGLDFLDTSITSSAWVLARMAPAAAGALNAMMHNGRIALDPQQKVIGMREDGSMGLGEVLGRLGDAKEIERFFGWVAGNRAAKLAAEGRENLFTAQDIEALKGINRGVTEDGRTRASLYDEVFKEFQQYRDDVLAIAEQTGIISSENRAMWRDEFYVPFYRVMDEEAKAKGPVSSKGLSRQEAYKKLKGGKQNLNDLLENTLMNFHHLLTASLKNQAAAQTIANAERLQIARKVPEAARDPKTSTFVLEKGEKVWYEVDDALVFEALSSLADPGLNNFAVRTMAKFKRVFTNMTTITPQFIIANFLRDSMQAAATTPVSKNVPANMFQGLKSFRDQKTRAQMLASGGAFSFGHIYGADPEEVKAGLKRSLRGAKLLDAPALVPKLLVAGWDAYNEAANTAENANRAAAFLQNQDKGALRAAYEARDLMDFSQEGAWPAVRFLIRVVPFLNARLQGLDKLYRSGFKPAVKVVFGKGTNSDKVAAARFAAVTGALALASLALYLANHDDEEYRKLEDWQKDSFWFFRVGDNGFFLPKPFEVGAISTLVERLAEQAVDDKASGKLFRERLWAMLTQTFSFSPVPQMFQPALDVYSNRDAFTGRPIESAGMEKLSPTLRDRASSTAPAKAISSATAVLGEDFALSPLQADHLIRGYLGQVGAWGAGIIDTVWRAASGESEPAKHWHEYQPIRRFYRDLGAPAPYDRYSTLFYEGLKESGRVYADAKRLQELGRKDEARELVQEKRQVLAMRKPLAEVQKQLSGINARMDMVRRSDWDGERKRRELDRLQAIKSRLTERAGKRIEDARARE